MIDAEGIEFLEGHDDRMIVDEIWKHNVYRLDEDRLCEADVLDVGSHHGIFTLYALSHGARWVTAVEADHEKLDQFRANLHHNGYRSGWDLLYGAAGSGAPARMTEPPNPHTLPGGDIPGFSLGDLLAVTPQHRVDICKVDIEGAEYDLILTASDVDLARIDYLTMEYHTPPWMPHHKDALWAKLSDSFTTVEEVGESTYGGGMLIASR